LGISSGLGCTACLEQWVNYSEHWRISNLNKASKNTPFLSKVCLPTALALAEISFQKFF
jgi:hypothetical protein